MKVLTKDNIQSECEHLGDLDYEWMWEGKKPYLVGLVCLDCGKDIIDSISDVERLAIEEDEQASDEDRVYDEYKDRYEN